MCACVRERSDMSRISNRATTVAATFAIVLLVILLVVLWTGAWSAGRINTVNRYQEGNVTDGGELFDESEPFRGSTERDDRSGAFKFDATSAVTISSMDDENFTNEVFSMVEIPKVEIPRPRFNHSTIEIPASKNREVEYIRLMKISQNLYEDPPDDYSTAQRHHSGHFRHIDAEIWDPHPQYEFTAFGQTFRLQLSHDTSFVAPDIKVTRIGENVTTREHPGHQLGCSYTGDVAGDPKSAVSVSLCHGMTGHMKTSSGSYFIKPTEHWQGVDKETPESTLQHAVHRLPASTSNSRYFDTSSETAGNMNCGVVDYDTDDAPAPLTDDSSGGKVYVGERRSRQRRSLTEKTSLDRSREISDNDDENEEAEYGQFVGQAEHHRNIVRNDNRYDRYYSIERKGTSSVEEYRREMELDPFATWRPRRALSQEYFIEIMVVADATMSKYHGDGLVNYILVLMSIVSRIYKDPSIGNPISIALMNIVQTDEIFGKQNVGGDGIAAGAVLKQFCHWQHRNNPDEPSPDHHDTALLLTRENLCHNPVAKSCDTLGLAELSTMCNAQNSCAIVQDNGLAAAFTIAHEIGHVLNMPHDDDLKCSSFRNRSAVHNVMSRMLDDNTDPWEWSKCSRHFVTEFLEAGLGNCLLDEPHKKMERSDVGRLPGEDFTKDKQCELVYGSRSRICPHMAVCRTLWCTAPTWDHRTQCHTQHMPWADGTACGVGKWCLRGECVSRRNLKPVDGQWGEWKHYEECSRTCGGGIRKKYRECDNPKPQNGGNYCIGERVKYRSCNTKECPPGSPDFREQQCSQFDNNNQNIQNLTRDVKWHAKYTKIPPKDRCRLHCYVQSNQYYKLREKVVDGTPCSPDTFHICVNGHCKSAGCDHVLNSTAELDTCGVCKGDNSTCQRITGSYNASIYGYTRVTKIPAGSSYIDVRQHGWMDSHNDSNYLALRLGEGGEYILNGNFMVMHQKVIVHPDVTIEYSGPELVVERLNSSRPTNIDLILEVLSAGEVHPPQIIYEYTVPKKFLENHTWIVSDWTACNRMCQGTRYRRAECRSTEHKDVVSDDYCSSEEKPREESQMCNGHCTLKWQITSVSECSNHCGPGTRTVQSRCIQIFNSDIRPLRPIPAHACSHIERPSDLEACMGPCNNAHWRYGEWGPCSVTCGGGIQFRSATCVDSNERLVADETCVGQEKFLKKSCAIETCPKWDLGEWSKCSATCGKGKRHRLYWCRVENRVVPHSYCSGPPADVMEACDAGPCHQWHAGVWSPCSVTCGEGTLRRKVACKSVDGSPSDKCLPSEKPEDTVACVLMPCPTVSNVPPITYSPDQPFDDPSQQENEIDSNGIIFRPGYKWRTGPYAECSKSCNGGLAHRIVKCASTETGITVSDDYCDRRRRPTRTVSCSNHPCPVWNTGDWGQCDATCGHGFQRRQVRCRNYHGDLVSDKECTAVEKPRHMKRCQKAPCVTPNVNKYGGETSIFRRWRTSNWTHCSKSCGNGIKTRRVECTMRRGNHGPELPVKDEHCSKYGLAKPKSQRFCQRAPCDNTWQEGPWSECTAKCGEGVQRRAVTCHRVNSYGWIDPTPSDGCPMNQRPISEQTCKLRECGDEFYWTAGPWRNCSHMCGRKGRQIRRLFCHDANGRKVPRLNCPRKFKPQRKRKCNQKRCGPGSCLEAQRRFKNTSDGEYPLIIGGKSMSIYCYGMASSEPREYLTLPAGGQENYAEIYNKRLMNPLTCPFDGQRNDSCPCFTELGTISGRTMFERVRIDPVKLYIISNDYTFSRTTGANRVEFGKAGDCYSRANCPQGRFSVNLRGTLLRLSADVTWIPQAPRAFLAVDRINDQRVVGKCGGYCGFCEPKTDLKLDVLPP